MKSAEVGLPNICNVVFSRGLLTGCSLQHHTTPVNTNQHEYTMMRVPLTDIAFTTRFMSNQTKIDKDSVTKDRS